MQAAKPIGRFAPSPTGDLHFGSLLAAMASFCDIKARLGLWQLRIDDIDAPRSVPGSADAIQKTLTTFGFEWDGPVRYQSQRLEHYHDALGQLVKERRIFTCNCSRRSLPATNIYPGRCRDDLLLTTSRQPGSQKKDHALRIRLAGKLAFEDAIQGPQLLNLDRQVGDVIVWRRDGLVSYSLACAVDDSDGTTHVVRGADLLDSTGAQVAIMRALQLPEPLYAHLPLAIDLNGDKLSKHSKAAAIIDGPILQQLLQAWHFLGQIQLSADSTQDFWKQALASWQTDKVPNKQRLSV